MDWTIYFMFWTTAISRVVAILFWSAFAYLLFMGALYIRARIKRRK